MQKYVYFENVFHTLYTEIKHKCQKNVPEKINGTKNAVFFLCHLIYHNFIFNLRFLYELKHKVHLSKTVCGIFHFIHSFY